MFRHFQAEAASISLPVSRMLRGNKLYQRPTVFATSLEQTAACHASPEKLSTAQLPCCNCQPALLTSAATHYLSSGSALTEWRAQTTFDWTGG